jgi:hypothetical protein
MKKLALVTTLAVTILSALAACSTERPVPPHQAGDGGRGLNPGARAESANGSDVSRPANER